MVDDDLPACGLDQGVAGLVKTGLDHDGDSGIRLGSCGVRLPVWAFGKGGDQPVDPFLFPLAWAAHSAPGFERVGSCAGNQKFGQGGGVLREGRD